MPLVPISPSSSRSEVQASSPLTPPPDSPPADNASSPDLYSSIEAIPDNFFDAIKDLELTPWQWKDDASVSKASLSKKSRTSLRSQVSIVRDADPDAISLLVQQLELYMNFAKTKTSKYIRLELVRVKHMDANKDEYKHRHKLSNESGLNHHSAVLLGHLIGLCSREIEKSAMLQVDGEAVDENEEDKCNRIDWRIDISSNEPHQEDEQAAGAHKKKARTLRAHRDGNEDEDEDESTLKVAYEVADDDDDEDEDELEENEHENESKSKITAIGIEFKPLHNASDEHMQDIWEFAKTRENGKSAKLQYSNKKIKTLPALESHAAGLVAQLIGYMRRHKMAYGMLYNGNEFLVVKRLGDKKYSIFNPQPNDVQLHLNLITVICALLLDNKLEPVNEDTSSQLTETEYIASSEGSYNSQVDSGSSSSDHDSTSTVTGLRSPTPNDPRECKRFKRGNPSFPDGLTEFFDEDE